MKLRVGDTVRHSKRKMTVLADEGMLSNGKQVVTCEWLDVNGVVKRDLFLAGSLELKKREEAGSSVTSVTLF